MVETTPTRPRGRPRKDETPAPPAEILAAALHAFATRGYDGVSVRTLCRELGVSHNLLNQRFGTKSALWYAAVDWGFGGLVERMEQAEVDSEDLFDRMHGAVIAFVEYSAEHPDLLGLVVQEAGVPSERLDHIYDTYIARAWAPFAPLYEELSRHAGSDVVPIRSLHFLITHGGASPFSSHALAMRLGPQDPFAAPEIRAHARFVADVVVAGIKQSVAG